MIFKGIYVKIRLKKGVKEGAFMLAENLLNEIGFSAEQMEKYREYKVLIGEKLEGICKGYMQGEIPFANAIEKAHLLEGLRKYTINIMFVLECTSYLLQKYNQKGVSKEIFINSMKDIKYKLDEALGMYNVFGIEPINWYERFLDMRRVALGRLQFNVAEFEQEDITVKGHTVKKGDFVLACHIPSAGQLKPEMCEESFKMAYDFFKDKVSNGILPVTCHSWILYPPYRNVFGENSNTGDFIRNYQIIKTEKTQDFVDAWRVFGRCFDGDITKLPQETTMQRNFINYIEKGGSFGAGLGLILLDGKRVITRK